MDFNLPEEVEKMRVLIRDFVNKEIIPLELDITAYDKHENIDEELLETLRKKARSRGLWALSMPRERGGQQLNTVGMAACYEEMGRSIFGPVVFNVVDVDTESLGSFGYLEYRTVKIGSLYNASRQLRTVLDLKR